MGYRMSPDTKQVWIQINQTFLSDLVKAVPNGIQRPEVDTCPEHQLSACLRLVTSLCQQDVALKNEISLPFVERRWRNFNLFANAFPNDSRPANLPTISKARHVIGQVRVWQRQTQHHLASCQQTSYHCTICTQSFRLLLPWCIIAEARKISGALVSISMRIIDNYLTYWRLHTIS